VLMTVPNNIEEWLTCSSSRAAQAAQVRPGSTWRLCLWKWGADLCNGILKALWAPEEVSQVAVGWAAPSHDPNGVVKR
jgi:hypothetical protein